MAYRIIQVAVPFVWFGLVLGLSFIEAPLKFQAPGITLPLGLGIGRLVFFVLNKIEIVLALLLIFSVIRRRPAGKFVSGAVGAIVLILLLETAWLLPALELRAEQVINGTATPFSSTHLFYIAFDAIKLVLLLAAGIVLTKQHLTLDRHE